MATCCPCGGPSDGGGGGSSSRLPLLCLVPREGSRMPGSGSAGPQPRRSSSAHAGTTSDFVLLDDDYIKKHFKLQKRALYLDPFRRPLITFPMTTGNSNNFNMDRKNKINQQILDGILDSSEAIKAPSVFPYKKTESTTQKEAEEDEEIIYILQLPDWEFKCPVHQQTIRTPRFVWHSCKKSSKPEESGTIQGKGPMNKPKPWLLSRHTNFDLVSQW